MDIAPWCYKCSDGRTDGQMGWISGWSEVWSTFSTVLIMTMIDELPLYLERVMAMIDYLLLYLVPRLFHPKVVSFLPRPLLFLHLVYPYQNDNHDNDCGDNDNGIYNDDLTMILARAATRKRRVAPPAQRAASTAQPTRSIIMDDGGHDDHDADDGYDHHDGADDVSGNETAIMKMQT